MPRRWGDRGGTGNAADTSPRTRLRTATNKNGKKSLKSGDFDARNTNYKRDQTAQPINNQDSGTMSHQSTQRTAGTGACWGAGSITRISSWGCGLIWIKGTLRIAGAVIGHLPHARALAPQDVSGDRFDKAGRAGYRRIWTCSGSRIWRRFWRGYRSRSMASAIRLARWISAHHATPLPSIAAQRNCQPQSVRSSARRK